MTDVQPIALGIDIGGTHTKIALVDRTGTVSSFRRIPTEAWGSNADAYLQNLVANARDVLAAADHEIQGIGMSVHGHIDAERRGPILCNNTPALRGVNLRGLLAEHFHCPVVVNNDLTAHTLAEYTFGSSNGTQRFVCLDWHGIRRGRGRQRRTTALR
jgi:predicted NBD/HSP70 family sugar kinase